MSNLSRILCLALLLGLLTQVVHADTATPIGSPNSAGSSNSSNHQPDWEDCVAFRTKVINSKKSKEILDELFLKIDEDDFCAKNILGILHAKGLHVEKDFEKSYAIFHNLSEKNYPPSQLNLALLLAKKEGHSSETLINLLIGIIVKYNSYTDTGEYECGWFSSWVSSCTGEEWAHIAGSARRFAQKYVDGLPLRTASRATLATRLREANTVSGTQLYTQLVKGVREQKETMDGIMSLIALGVLVYQVSVPTRAPNTYYPRGRAPDPATLIPPTPRTYYYSGGVPTFGGGSLFAR